MITSKTALILIDVQNGFDDEAYWGPRNNPQAEANMARLLNAWRETNRPVIFIQHTSVHPHSPLYPGQVGCEIKKIVEPLPHEPLFTKTVNSAFIGTNLESYLREQEIDSLVITGLTTDHCVSTTTRMAGNFGFNVYLVADGTATFDKIGYDGTRYSAEDVHNLNLASLHKEFATVVETDQVMGMMMQNQEDAHGGTR